MTDAEHREHCRTERRDSEVHKRRHGMRVSGGSIKRIQLAVHRRLARDGR